MKSDVFSFGVLVLEIVSGKRNRGLYAFSPHLNLVAHVSENLKNHVSTSNQKLTLFGTLFRHGVYGMKATACK